MIYIAIHKHFDHNQIFQIDRSSRKNNAITQFLSQSLSHRYPVVIKIDMQKVPTIFRRVVLANIWFHGNGISAQMSDNIHGLFILTLTLNSKTNVVNSIEMFMYNRIGGDFLSTRCPDKIGSNATSTSASSNNRVTVLATLKTIVNRNSKPPGPPGPNISSFNLASLAVLFVWRWQARGGGGGCQSRGTAVCACE